MDKKERDEYMEALWYLSEEEDPCVDDLQSYTKTVFTDEVIAELRKEGYVTQNSAGTVEPTKKGYDEARQIVRCHRLAERLLTDVLGMQPKETEAGACEFEHVIIPEIADSICTLLGHPRECPHGLKIPEGKCCKAASSTIQSAIVPLDRVKVGERVKVSYIKTLSNSRMHKLSHFGIIPGAEVSIHQRNPSFIIQCGNTQVAMEEDVAKEVYVMYAQEAEPETPGHGQRRRWRRFRKK